MLNDRAPEVIDMLNSWGFDIARFSEVAAWQNENSDASINDAALWWLKQNSSVWSSWVTSDAAGAISEALDENKIPDGWPEG